MATRKTTIYPRFLGVDGDGDNVWELPTGRWTWGDEPVQAATRTRTFTPDRYLDKFGPVRPLVTVESHPGKPPVVKVDGAEVPMVGPVESTRDELVDAVQRVSEEIERMDVTGRVKWPEDNQRPDLEQARRALITMVRVLRDWREGAKSNHEGMDHRGESSPCWDAFTVGDIRNMIDDAARELGITDLDITAEEFSS